MSFPQYPKYKNSGVEWLGAIPEHWSVCKVKHLAKLRSGDAIPSEQIQDAGEYPVFGGNGLRGFTSNFTHEGDFPLIGRQGALCGNVNIASGRFWASEHAVVASPSASVNVRWLGELLRAMDLNQHSTSAAQPGLSVEVIGSLSTVCAPFREQAAIALFLEAETRKIDALLGEQRRLIELLQEKWRAVISHAVTKGLNPDIRMKPSGVDWLGDIPSHWSVTRLKNLFDVVRRAPLPDDEIVTAFRDGTVTLRRNRRIDGFTNAVQEHGYQRILPGDLVIHAMDAFAGAIGVSDSEGKSTPVYSVCRPRAPWVNAVYYAEVLRHMALSGYINSLSKGIRERSTEFRWSEASEVVLPVLPADEQDCIVSYIESQVTEIACLANEIGDSMRLLEERRAAVIAAAVTGKIDVRDYAPAAIEAA